MKKTLQIVHVLFVLTIVVGLVVGATGSGVAGPGNGQGPPEHAGDGNGHGPPDDAGDRNGNGPPDHAGGGQDDYANDGQEDESQGNQPGDSTIDLENRTIYNESTGMTLFAGQNIAVGNVTVTRNGSDHLDITYETSGGWELTETHLAVSPNDTSAIPETKSGNPKVGRFPFNGTHDSVETVTYTVEIPEPNDGNITIAAHAVVEHPDEGEETAWADGDRFTERGNWATYFTYQLGDENVCPVSSDPGAGFVEILGVDSSNYPTINSTVRVNTTEGTAGNLTEEEFIVCEDDRLQDESVSFVQSGTTGIDLVFTLDVSGSMGGEIQTLQVQMRDYIQSFSENNTNARFALITYGGSEEGGDGIVQQPLTDNVTAMQEAINDTSPSGGFENATDAYIAAQNLSTRAGASKVIVDVTDEDDDGYYPNTNATNGTLDKFETEGWLYVAISPDLYGGDPADDQRTYAERLDGQWTDIQEIRDGNTTLDVVLRDLQAQLVTTYLVSYTTNLPTNDGSSRTVLIHVDDPSGTAAETDTYIAPT